MTDETRIDLLLKSVADKPDHPVDAEVFLDYELKETDEDASSRVTDRLASEGIADKKASNLFFLTPLGQKIVNSGGYLKHLEKLAQERREQEEREKILHRKTEVEYLNASWLYKTRWWPHILSGCAIIISLIALVESILKD